MAQNAADTGAEFLTKSAVCGIAGTRLLTRGIGGKKEFSFRMLIAADGPRSTIARLLNMQRAPTYLAGIQADIPYSMNRHFVEIYPDAAPDFFGYAIPTGNGRARIGLCTELGAKERFAAFARRFTDRTLHLVTGTVPLGIMPKTYGHRTLFCGDAAGFAKPTSGGGVYTGIRSARYAAAVAATCCEQDRYDDPSLSAYQNLWQKDLGATLRAGYRFFMLRQQLKQEEIDRLIRAMNDPGIIEAIVRYGDMDQPGVLLRHLMKKPAVIEALGTLLRPAFLSLFSRKNNRM